MRCKALSLMLLAALVILPRAAADTVTLRDGDVVEGKIEKVEADGLAVRTEDGVTRYSREEIRTWTVEKTGPNGEKTVATFMFKPKPLEMPFETKTEHYLVKTDIDERVCKRAGKAMEQLYRAYNTIFRLGNKTAKKKVEVIIFDKEEDFRKYANETSVKPREDTLGFFRAHGDGSSQIVTFKRRTDEFDTMSTLYHEATHQFITMKLGVKNPPPLWLNEGMAVYFENSRWVKEKLKTGFIPRERLKQLQRAIRNDEYVHLADLIKRDRDTYDSLCYAEGWSLVYFFVKVKRGAYAKRVVKYLDMLEKGENPDRAFRKCFTRDLDKLEKAWKEFVLQLKVPDN